MDELRRIVRYLEGVDSPALAATAAACVIGTVVLILVEVLS